MPHYFRPLTVGTLILVLLCTACSTDPQTGERHMNKAVLYGGSAALLGGALGALHGGRRDAINAALIAGAAGTAVGAYVQHEENEMRQKLAHTQVGIERLGNQLKLTLPDNVMFDFNRADVKPAAISALQSIAQVMQSYPETHITVAGYTDNIGSDSYNMQLSQKRAQAVSTLLETQGIPPTRIRTIGFGKSQPLATNTTPAGRAHNRRVEILIDPIQR